MSERALDIIEEVLRRAGSKSIATDILYSASGVLIRYKLPDKYSHLWKELREVGEWIEKKEANDNY